MRFLGATVAAALLLVGARARAEEAASKPRPFQNLKIVDADGRIDGDRLEMAVQLLKLTAAGSKHLQGVELRQEDGRYYFDHPTRGKIPVRLHEPGKSADATTHFDIHSDEIEISLSPKMQFEGQMASIAHEFQHINDKNLKAAFGVLAAAQKDGGRADVARAREVVRQAVLESERASLRVEWNVFDELAKIDDLTRFPELVKQYSQRMGWSEEQTTKLLKLVGKNFRHFAGENLKAVLEGKGKLALADLNEVYIPELPQEYLDRGITRDFFFEQIIAARYPHLLKSEPEVAQRVESHASEGPAAERLSKTEARRHASK